MKFGAHIQCSRIQAQIYIFLLFLLFPYTCEVLKWPLFSVFSLWLLCTCYHQATLIIKIWSFSGFRKVSKIPPIATRLSISQSVCVCYFSEHSSYVGENQNCKNVVYRVWYFPSNGIIVKVVLCDLDLLFESQTFYMLISETVRARAKIVCQSFVVFYICHRMVSLQKLYSMTWTYLLKVKH